MRVLVVEDDSGIRGALLDILAMEELPADAVADGLAALYYIHEHKPSLVVLDMNLPKISGQAVGVAIHEKWGGEVPILAITADGQIECKALAAMATDALVKPFSISEFLQHVYLLLPKDE